MCTEACASSVPGIQFHSRYDESSAGHDRELEQIKGTALKAGSAFIDNAQGFVKGVQKGFDEHNKR